MADDLERIERVNAVTMSVEVGKEIEVARHRLSDIIFLAEKTEPVNGDWEGYARQMRRMIADSAKQATNLLAVVQRG